MMMMTTMIVTFFYFFFFKDREMNNSDCNCFLDKICFLSYINKKKWKPLNAV